MTSTVGPPAAADAGTGEPRDHDNLARLIRLADDSSVTEVAYLCGSAVPPTWPPP